VAETPAFGRALHQARDVGHHELGFVPGPAHPDHTEMGLEGGDG